ncbi:DNA polymerase III subunit beta [Candidatus Wolfebacteria bacterium CG03_land_8_20_14_0_80_40_12]|uniref:Beta sliding clamp n=1 Tax=Candidatus Wolfebacteria bacterium CG03_land_8_20_14_0_80_40_12 TaxID=1975069 RepID=A0A2M7B5T6_9BACT|nr:MAG: DNA polymerase III subunit beta [Candidatus Wolfebacteria bacterium CG03_land_8_20_14_0_80_40_12]
MKIIILKNYLKIGLEVVGGVINENTNTTLPILKNFLIETIDNKIRLSTTNLELAVTYFVPGKIIENGSLTIPFSIFNSIINNLWVDRINLEVEENNLIIKTDNYQAKIQGIKKDEFPILPQIKEKNNFFKISVSIFKKALLSLISAAQFSEIKPELNGVLFDFQLNFLKLAATDSFRLAEKTIINTQFESNLEQGFKAIIPLKTIQEITKALKEKNDDKLDIYFDQSQIFLRNENIEIISRLVNNNFPDYQSIIPQSFETEIVLGKEQLINAIKLTSSFTDKLNEVKILIKEKSKNIEIRSSNQVVGENQYLIPAKISGRPLEIIFNWRFILDGIKNLESENVFIGFNGDNKPALIKPPADISYFYILMPVKSI